MFYVFGVDLVIESAHRCYERSWPKYKGVKTNLGASYDQPRAPVEVILGSKNKYQFQEAYSSENSSAPVPRELYVVQFLSPFIRYAEQLQPQNLLDILL